MKVVKISLLGDNLVLTGVDPKGDIKIGILPKGSKKKVEWYDTCLK